MSERTRKKCDPNRLVYPAPDLVKLKPKMGGFPTVINFQSIKPQKVTGDILLYHAVSVQSN